MSEEIPLYSTLLAGGFRLFGEHDWVGRLLSLAGTLIALIAFYCLTRRHMPNSLALTATAFLAASPLFIFYGRAVMPDSWMLASMLGSALFYRTYLDTNQSRWFLLAALCGLAAGVFKYFGLMVVIPLAEMTRRAQGSWLSLFKTRFLGLIFVMAGPILLWMALVFFNSPNPVKSGWAEGHVYPYFTFQSPLVLVSKGFYSALFLRFPLKDCGPITVVCMLSGIFLLSRLPQSQQQLSRAHWLQGSGFKALLGGWTVMGLGFFVLLGPKLRDHDYYELMMMPAAAIWASLGLNHIAKQFGPAYVPRRVIIFAVLSAMVIVQSPWTMGSLFHLDQGKLLFAKSLREASAVTGRVIAIGPGIEFPTAIHYSQREGWAIHSPLLPENWRKRLENYRHHGATLVGVYFEPKASVRAPRFLQAAH